jgi:hypothetical protein
VAARVSSPFLIQGKHFKLPFLLDVFRQWAKDFTRAFSESDKANRTAREKIEIYLGARVLKMRFACFALSQKSLCMQVQLVHMAI